MKGNRGGKRVAGKLQVLCNGWAVCAQTARDMESHSEDARGWWLGELKTEEEKIGWYWPERKKPAGSVMPPTGMEGASSVVIRRPCQGRWRTHPYHVGRGGQPISLKLPKPCWLAPIEERVATAAARPLLIPQDQQRGGRGRGCQASTGRWVEALQWGG